MKQHAAAVAILVSLTFTATLATASPLAPGSVDAKGSSKSAPQELSKARQAPEPDSASPKGHTFEVNDAKGLLLKCNAPQLDSDPDTDLFDGCTLAPGRTLDDVMHTFIQAIHFVQNEHAKERAEWNKEHEEKSDQEPGQK